MVTEIIASQLDLALRVNKATAKSLKQPPVCKHRESLFGPNCMQELSEFMHAATSCFYKPQICLFTEPCIH